MRAYSRAGVTIFAAVLIADTCFHMIAEFWTVRLRSFAIINDNNGNKLLALFQKNKEEKKSTILSITSPINAIVNKAGAMLYQLKFMRMYRNSQLTAREALRV